MKKRLITMVLALSMALAMVPVQAASLPGDVSGSWCKDYVSNLMDKGIVGGYSDGTYRPTAPVSRGAIAKMAFLTMQTAGSSLKESTENDPFSDMKGNWAEGYAAILANTGNLLPSEFGYKYEASKDMTRLETAKLLTRIYIYAHPDVKLDSSAKLDFSDTTDLSASDASLVAKAVELGIINGYKDGTFKPNASINRGTAAAMISRFLGTVGTISDPAQFVNSSGGNGSISTDTTGAPEIQNVEWVIKPSIKVEQTGNRLEENFMIPFSSDGIGGYIKNENGKEIRVFVDKNGRTYQFNSSIIASKFIKGYALARNGIGGKVGLIDLSGKWVVEPVYDDWRSMPDSDWKTAYMAEREEIQFTGTVQDSGGEVWNSGTKGGLFVYAKRMGSDVFDADYKGICDQDGRIIVKATPKVSSWGEGEAIHGCYDTATAYDDCIVMVHQITVGGAFMDDIYDGKTGKLTGSYMQMKSAAEKYGVPYRVTGGAFSQGLCAAALEESSSAKYGYMDKTCEMVIPPVFDRVASFSNGYAWVKYNGLWGVIKLPQF